MLAGKPYFTLTVESDRCVGFVHLNGQEQFEAQMAPARVVLPVNHWLREGENELRMMFAPVDEEGEFGTMAPSARCTLTLKVRESGTGEEGDRTVAALRFAAGDPTGIGGNTPEQRLASGSGFSPSPGGDVLVGPAKRDTYQEMATLVSRTVTLPRMGLPAWKFFGSDDLTGLAGPDVDGRMDPSQSEPIREALLPVYRGIWEALRAGRVDEVVPLYEERSAETDASLFRRPGGTAALLAAALKDSVADPHQELWPITDDNVMVSVSDNDKLARLCQNNRKPLLSFSIVPEGGACHYDAIFRRSGGKWILTR